MSSKYSKNIFFHKLEFVYFLFISRFAYLPFGQGPRACIGMRFAMMETKLALANIIRKFKLIPSEKTIETLKLDPMAAITYVKGGLYIKVETRD